MIWATTFDFQQCGMCNQPVHMYSLIRAFASCLSILWLLSYWPNIILSYKTEREAAQAQRSLNLHLSKTCQNATFLEIKCRGSIMAYLSVYLRLKEQNLHFKTYVVALNKKHNKIIKIGISDCEFTSKWLICTQGHLTVKDFLPEFHIVFHTKKNNNVQFNTMWNTAMQ